MIMTLFTEWAGITPDEALLRLKAIVDRGGEDPDGDHWDADEVLLACIGDPDIRDLFHSIDKWYS